MDRITRKLVGSRLNRHTPPRRSPAFRHQPRRDGLDRSAQEAEGDRSCCRLITRLGGADASIAHPVDDTVDM
jgi:hypothetical protein